MKNRRLILMFIFLGLIFIVSPSFGCTTFCFQNQGDWIFGRNYDWDTGHCLLIVNKKGVAKTAWRVKNPAQWVSKYGSITFNQYGREFPLGGMNEAGLVIECMWLRATRYPALDTRPALQELQWTQYLLDTCATIQDVVARIKQVRINAKDSYPIHFLLCDAKGKAAVIEFLDGRANIYRGKDLPVKALSNSTYPASREFLKTSNGDEHSTAFKRAGSSLKRFVYAAGWVKQWRGKNSGDPVDYAFNALYKTAVRRTMFQVVYDVKHRRIYYCNKRNREIRVVDFKHVSFACQTAVKILDIHKGKAGNTAHLFMDYSPGMNHSWLTKAVHATPRLKKWSEKEIKLRAFYPSSLKCK